MEKMLGGWCMERAMRFKKKEEAEIDAMWAKREGELRLGKEKGKEKVEWTVFGGKLVEKINQRAKAEAKWLMGALEEKAGVTVRWAEVWFRKIKEKIGGMSCDMTGEKEGVGYGWMELKCGDSEETLREAVRGVERMEGFAREAEQYCIPGVGKLSKPKWVGYVVVEAKQWRFKWRKVGKDGTLGKWEENRTERVWSRGTVKRGRKRKHADEAARRKAWKDAREEEEE